MSTFSLNRDGTLSKVDSKLRKDIRRVRRRRERTDRNVTQSVPVPPGSDAPAPKSRHKG